MKVYVAGALADVENVRAAQAAVMAAGHELTLDWTRGPDATLEGDYGSHPEHSGRIAAHDLEAVLAADAVLVLASEHEGRGMFAELGAALALASRGELEHVGVVGPIRHESVFFFHPAVRRVPTVHEWLATLRTPDERVGR
ncbi:hypothetical protein ACFP3Q_04420 [Nocardioides sp. GCM10027113]|uniref:hypothetical protein n=1 Tax=unclassified Nocardioides TaxID=2615069 RepID=UPI00360C7404